METKQKFSLNLPSAIIITGVLIAGAILLRGIKAPSPAPGDTGEPKVADLKPRALSASEHVRGDLKAAQVVILEYSDTECPFCKRFHSTMQEVMDNYSGKVAWVYRHFPLDSLHPKARKEAEALECAASLGGNEKFWAYTDRIFEITPANNGLDPNELPKIAEYVGLDKSAFTACLESGQFASKVQADVDDGIKINVRGTPYSLVFKNGKPVAEIPGALPYEQVKQILDKYVK